MRRWLPELFALPLLPWLLAQGKHARKITPRMPEAAGARQGMAVPAEVPACTDALRLFAIGESTVAGVGVDVQEQALTAQLARSLARHWQRPVSWEACGKNGATVRDALDALAAGELQLAAAPAQVVLVAFGVNDTTGFHSASRYRRDLQAMLEHLEQNLQPQLLVVTGVPPVHAFSAIPQPLRHILGMKARVLTRVVEHVVAQRARRTAGTRTMFVPVIPGHPDLLAYDGYHPAAEGVRQWADSLAQSVASQMPA